LKIKYGGKDMKKILGCLMILLFLAISPIQTNAADITVVLQENRNIGRLLGIDEKYDLYPGLMDANELKKLGRIIKDLPLLEARFKIKILPNIFDVPEGEKEIKDYAVGIFRGDYILSVAHFTKNPSYDLNTPFGARPVPIEVGERKIFISVSEKKLELREIKIDFEQDWALFETPEELKGKYLSPKIGESNELKPGHFLYFIGRSFDDGILLRSGIIEAENFELRDTGLAIKKEDVFAMSGGVYPGDSGGPVFALRDGKLELVGIMKSTRLYTNIGHALKIGPILEKIKAATGIDLR
jgi:hypothetical protein